MIFDTAAGELSPHLFHQKILPALDHLARAHPQKLGYYSRGTTTAHLQHPSFGRDSAWAGLGVDHRWDLPATLRLPHKGFLQGNFDQALLHCETEDFKKHLHHFVETLTALTPEERKGWVCGLGHGVLPKTPESHVRMFVETLRRAFE